MGKKKANIMEAQKERFLAGARKKKVVPAAKAAKIFAQMAKFAEYGFNKSHSAAYAALAYQTAYLKAHYPAHFMAAMMTSEADRGATSQVVKYINECQLMGIAVLPPDINESDLNFSPARPESGGPTSIRFGLAAVKNVGETSALDIIDLRAGQGKFVSPFDICRDPDAKAVNKRVLESLIKAGAFDSLGLARSQCFHLIDAMLQFSHEVVRAKNDKQTLLFGGDRLEPPEIPAEIRTMRPWDEALTLSYEKDALGFYISGHPLAQYKNLRSLITHTVSELDDARDAGTEVRLAGIISGVKPLKTKKDESMAAFILEDMSGQVDVIAFPEPFRKFYEYIREDTQVWLKGKFVADADSRKVQVLHIMPLAGAFLSQAKKVVIRIFVPGLEETVLDSLRDILEKHPGECPVVFELETPHVSRVVTQSVEVKGVAPSDAMAKAIEDVLGEDSVIIEY
jgi:DNA polymerase-3 subunit alpha